MGRRKIDKFKLGMSKKPVKGIQTVPAEGAINAPYVPEGKVFVGEGNFDAYLNFLNAREECTSRMYVNGKSLKVVQTDRKAYLAMVKAGYDKDMLDDVANIGMYVRRGKDMIPISNAGDATLKRIVNANWERIPASIKAAAYNYALEGDKDYVLIVQEGKVLGVMSSVYTPFPANSVMGTVKDAIVENYGEEVECVRTMADHIRYEVEFRLLGEEAKNMSEVLLDQLKARYAANGLDFDATGYDPSFGFVVRTGETGNDTVSVRAKVKVDCDLGGLMVGDNITVYHKGDKDIKNCIAKKTKNLFASFEDTMKQLIQAADYTVLDWRSTIVNIAEFAKIPDDVWKKMVVKFADRYGNQVVTGFDILSAFMDASGIYLEVNPSATEQMRDMFNVKLSIAMGVNVADYDNNESAVRQQLSTQEITFPANVLEGVAKELKIPVYVLKKLRANLQTSEDLYRISHMNAEKPWKALDIYELLTGSTTYIKEWYEGKKGLVGDELDEKIAAYNKVLAKAKDVSYIIYDKEVETA